jgi:hypothetical protein
MSRVSSTPQTRASRAGNGICRSTGYSAMRSGGSSRRITSRCQPDGHQAKQLWELSREMSNRLQGPGTAGMIVWRSQARLAIGRRRRSRRAAGLNARPPCVDGMRWRVNGLSCAVRRLAKPSFGRLAHEGTPAMRREDCQSG